MTARMKHVRNLKANSLIWAQPKAMQRHHVLTSNGDVYATLTWVKSFGSLAEAVCSEGKFTLKRGGFLHPYVTVRKLPFENEVAKLQIAFGWNGLLEFNDGWKFTLQKLSFWKNHWGFTDMNNRLICRIEQRSRMLKQSADVTLEKDAKREPRLPLILIVAWYAVILHNEERGAAGAATAASAGAH